MKMNDLACRLSLLNYAMILSEGGPVLRKTNIEFSSCYGVISLLRSSLAFMFQET